MVLFFLDVDSPVPWQYPQNFFLKPFEKQGGTEEYLSALLGGPNYTYWQQQI